jgi:hypothetical protein
VRFTVTPFVEDPDLFVSTLPNPGPNQYMWKSTTRSNDTVQVFAQDPRACTPPCRYYVGVSAFALPADEFAYFTIVAQTSSSGPLYLLDGTAQVRCSPIPLLGCRVVA